MANKQQTTPTLSLALLQRHRKAMTPFLLLQLGKASTKTVGHQQSSAFMLPNCHSVLAQTKIKILLCTQMASFPAQGGPCHTLQAVVEEIFTAKLQHEHLFGTRDLRPPFLFLPLVRHTVNKCLIFPVFFVPTGWPAKLYMGCQRRGS